MTLSGGLHQSLAPWTLPPMLDVPPGTPALVGSATASRSWHISSARITHLRSETSKINSRSAREGRDPGVNVIPRLPTFNLEPRSLVPSEAPSRGPLNNMGPGKRKSKNSEVSLRNSGFFLKTRARGSAPGQARSPISRLGGISRKISSTVWSNSACRAVVRAAADRSRIVVRGIESSKRVS